MVSKHLKCILRRGLGTVPLVGAGPGAPFLHEASGETLTARAQCGQRGEGGGGGIRASGLCVSHILPVFWGILLNFPIPQRASGTTCFARVKV